MTNIQERALQLAEQWANDGERLAGLLRQQMSIEQWEMICLHLARCFVALTDNGTRETCKAELLLQVGHIHAEVVENVFMPLAERMIAAGELLEAA